MDFFKRNSWILNVLLLVITFVTTLFAGKEWMTNKTELFNWYEYLDALPYTFAVLFILLSHEFGHYIAARIHKVDASLPYLIPFPPFSGSYNFGTMGAVIKTRSHVENNKALFDIGIAGPLTGFIACVIVLIIGYNTLPGPEYILKIYPDYFSPDFALKNPQLKFGDTFLFVIIRNFFADSGQFIPPMSEIRHYPLLNAGWFGLFITSLNLLPVGQLDGGHIIYAMFGIKKHDIVASITWYAILFLGFFALIDTAFNLGFGFGWMIWLFWGVILRFILKLKHPEVDTYIELNPTRKILGYISFIIFIISFTPSPFIISVN